MHGRYFGVYLREKKNEIANKSERNSDGYETLKKITKSGKKNRCR
jgi:hypothetical protein